MKPGQKLQAAEAAADVAVAANEAVGEDGVVSAAAVAASVATNNKHKNLIKSGSRQPNRTEGLLP